MPRNRVSFTAKELRKIEPPPRGPKGEVRQVDYWDATAPGFGLRVSSTGRRSWVFVARVRGTDRQARFTLGDYAEREGDFGLTLAQARTEAAEVKGSMRHGQDPRALERAALAREVEQARTFGAVVNEFLDWKGGAEPWRPSTKAQYKSVLKGSERFPGALATWRPRPIAEIQQADVRGVIEELATHGKTGVVANRTLAILSSFFHWSKKRSYVKAIPTEDIDRPAMEVKRKRHLFGDVLRGRPSELALAWHAMEAAGPLRGVFRLLLLTGQRLREVAGMEWAELIDLEGEQPRWLLPAARAKNGNEHLVPLCPMAAAIIAAAPRLARSKFIFTTTGTTPVSGFSRAKALVDLRIAQMQRDGAYAGQFKEPWRLHDLRRTFKTGLAELGVSKEVRDALTNHAKEGIDVVYDQARHESGKRAAMLRWEAHVQSVLTEIPCAV